MKYLTQLNGEERKTKQENPRSRRLRINDRALMTKKTRKD